MPNKRPRTSRGSVVVRVSALTGDAEPEVLSVPLETTLNDLRALTKNFLNQKDASNLAFYASKEGHDEDVLVTQSLEEALRKIDSTAIVKETTWDVRYHPLSKFKVDPVSRCGASLPGHTDAVLHVAFSSDGSMLASGGGDGTVRFWDTKTNTLTKTGRGHKNHVLHVAFCPTMTKLVSCDKSGNLIVWSIDGNRVGDPIKAHKTHITSIAFEPLHLSDSPRLLTASKDKLVKMWDLSTRKRLSTLAGHGEGVESVVWSGENYIYSASRDRTINVWRCAQDGKFELARTLRGHAHRVNFCAVSNGWLVKTGAFELGSSNEFSKENALVRYENAKRESATTDKVPFERLATCSDDHTLFLWYPTQQAESVTRMTGHQAAVTALSFSPDGRYLASCSFDKKVRIWDGRTGAFLALLHGHVGSVYAASWSADSRALATASKDSSIKIWSVGSLSRLTRAHTTLGGHADEVYALDWAADGSAIATGSKDRLVKIWTR